MMAGRQKRKISDLDPDYEDVDEHQKKRQKLIEATGKEATLSKIESIFQVQFAEAIKEKEVQINVINQRLSEAQRMLDKLRACIVSSYYSIEETGGLDWQGPIVPIPIHPTVKKPLAKRPKENPYLNINGERASSSQNHNNVGRDPENTLIGTMGGHPVVDTSSKTNKLALAMRMKDGKIKHRVTIGNISRYMQPFLSSIVIVKIFRDVFNILSEIFNLLEYTFFLRSSLYIIFIIYLQVHSDRQEGRK